MPKVVPAEEIPGYVVGRCDVIVSTMESPCWLWTKSLTNTGYGMVSHDGKQWLVHRLMYTLAVGPIPKGLELDHLCRNPACCNPEHLEAVTHTENCRRGLQGKINNCQSAKTHCPAGHPYDRENTRLGTQKSGVKLRVCKMCKLEKSRIPALTNNLSITHCPHGHEYSLENTYVDKMNKRRCKMCLRSRKKPKKEMVN